jgi:hypothetical protein
MLATVSLPTPAISGPSCQTACASWACYHPEIQVEITGTLVTLILASQVLDFCRSLLRKPEVGLSQILRPRTPPQTLPSPGHVQHVSGSLSPHSSLFPRSLPVRMRHLGSACSIPPNHVASLCPRRSIKRPSFGWGWGAVLGSAAPPNAVIIAIGGLFSLFS